MTKHKKFLKNILTSSSVLAILSSSTVAYGSATIQSTQGNDISTKAAYAAQDEPALNTSNLALLSGTLPLQQDITEGAEVAPVIQILHQVNFFVDKENTRLTAAPRFGISNDLSLGNSNNNQALAEYIVGDSSDGNTPGAFLALEIQSEQSSNTMNVSGQAVFEFREIDSKQGHSGFKQTVFTAGNALLNPRGFDTKEYTGDIVFDDSKIGNMFAYIVFSEDGKDAENTTEINQNFSGNNGIIFIRANHRKLTGEIVDNPMLVIARDVQSAINIETKSPITFSSVASSILIMEPGLEVKAPIDIRFSARGGITGDDRDPARYVLVGSASASLSLDGDDEDADINGRGSFTFTNTHTSGEGVFDANPFFSLNAEDPNEYNVILSYINQTDNGSGNPINLDMNLSAKMQGSFMLIDGSYNVTKPQGTTTYLDEEVGSETEGKILPATRFIKLSGTTRDMQRISKKITAMGMYTGVQNIKGAGDGSELVSPRFIAQGTTFDTSEGSIYLGMTKVQADAEKNLQEQAKTRLVNAANQAIADAKSQEEGDAAQAQLKAAENTEITLQLTEGNPNALSSTLINSKIKLHGEGQNFVLKSQDNRIAGALDVDFGINNAGSDIAAPLLLPVKDNGKIGITHYVPNPDGSTEEIEMTQNTKLIEEKRKLVLATLVSDTNNLVKYNISLSNVDLDKVFADGEEEKVLEGNIFGMSDPNGNILQLDSTRLGQIKTFYDTHRQRFVMISNSKAYEVEIVEDAENHIQFKLLDRRKDIRLAELRDSASIESEDLAKDFLRFTSRNNEGEFEGKLPKISERIGKIIEEKGPEEAKKFIKQVKEKGKREDEASINIVSQISSSLSGVVSARIDSTAISSGDDNMTGGGRKKFGIWVEPFYQYSQQEVANQGDVGYMANTHGLTAGFDSRINDNTTLGIAGNISKSTVRYNGGTSDKRDRTTANNAFLFLYGSYDFGNNFAMQSKLLYGFSKIRTFQIIDDEEVVSRHKTNIYGGEIMGSYRFATLGGRGHITPSFGLSYTRFERGQTTQTGGVADEGLQTIANNFKKMELIAAVSTSVDVQLQGGSVITPQARASLRHNTNRDEIQTVNDFEDVSGETTPVSSSPARTMFDLGAGLMVTKGTLEYGLNYDATFARKYQSHKGSIKVRVNL